MKMARKPVAAEAEDMEELDATDEAEFDTDTDTEGSEDDDLLEVIELEETLEDVEPPPLLPKNRYKGVISDVKEKTSGKGNDYYNIAITIPLSELPADLQDEYEEDLVFFYNRLLKPSPRDRRSLVRVKKFYQTLGLSAAITQIDPNDWLEREVMVVIAKSKWQGEDRNEIANLERVIEKPTTKTTTRRPR